MDKEVKLVLAGINNYSKKDIADSPLICIEAIGFLKACKIVIPEESQKFDEMIDNYVLLLSTIALGK